MDFIAYLKKYNILSLKDTEILLKDKDGLKLIQFAHEYGVILTLKDLCKGD